MSEVLHNIIDSDARFVFDPITNKLSTISNKKTLAQGSHERERFTFELPRYIEGHDMSLCNQVEVHYCNTEAKTPKRKSEDVYEANDLTIEGDKVIFSWLIRNTATRYAGGLSFSFHLKRVDDDGNLLYECPSNAYDKISISAVQNSSAQAVEPIPDLLASWKANALEEVNESLAEAETAKDNALSSAQQAAGSASSASASATNAATSEKNAEDSERAAALSEQNASTSESNAATSATNASASATNAKASEDNAKASENAAKTSEDNAKASEKQVAEDAETVEQAKNLAVSKATEAETSANEAKASEESALESAIEAATVAAPAILCNASGEFISVNDSAERLVQGFKVIGKTTQNGTPTPDAPIDIECVPQGTTIRVCGKNVFDKSKSGEAAIRNETADQLWAKTVYSHVETVKMLKPSTTYTLTMDIECVSVPEHTENNSSRMGLWVYSGNGYTTLTLSDNHYMVEGETYKLTKTFTTPETIADDAANYRIFAYTNRYLDADGNGVLSEMIFRNIQFEEGDTATDYEAFKGYELTTPCDLYEGDIWYPQTGKVVSKTVKFVFNGSESWGFYTGKAHTFTCVLPNGAITDVPAWCTDYKGIGAHLFDVEIGFYPYHTASALISDLRFSTVADFKAHLAEKYANGNPVTIVSTYRTGTKESQYEPVDLSTLKTYKPITIISNGAGAIVDVVYLADTKIYLDHIEQTANSVRADADAGLFNGTDYVLTAADKQEIVDDVLEAIPKYEGNYSITPAIEEQVIETQNKLLNQNMHINAIPYYETTNADGGITVIIGE